ncbi:MAG: DUF3783 domain-containing protein [Ruthenibacterium sp.]
MKAHILGAALPLALLYGLPRGGAGGAGGVGDIVRAVLTELCIPARDIAPSQLDETVGALANAAVFGASNAPAADSDAAENAAQSERLLLLANLPDDLLNTLLGALRSAGAPPMLKAIVTKHNKAWTVRALLCELLREKQTMEEART